MQDGQLSGQRDGDAYAPQPDTVDRHMDPMAHSDPEAQGCEAVALNTRPGGPLLEGISWRPLVKPHLPALRCMQPQRRPQGMAGNCSV